MSRNGTPVADVIWINCAFAIHVDADRRSTDEIVDGILQRLRAAS